jgi:triacylglycerol lipase
MTLKVNEALKYAQLLALTEGVNLYNNLDGMKDTVTALGYTYLHTIHGSQLASYWTPRLGSETMFGFVAQGPDGEYVVAIRCTETLMEAFHDVAFLPIPCPIKGARTTLVAAGFSALYKSLRVIDDKGEEFLPEYLNRIICSKYSVCPSKITLVGHSLGGPLVTLLALDLTLNTAIVEPKVYTFGSPRTGGPLFAHLYNKHIKESHRIVERWDPVQAVPILPLYWHVGQKEVIRGKWSLNPLQHHHLKTYIDILEEMNNDQH